MTRVLVSTAALCIGLTLPASADPLFGVGLTVTFGGGASEAGVGVRVFSDDERDEYAASAGVDFMFQSQRVRPTVGAAYLGSDAYIGFDLGYNYDAGAIDYGLSVGGLGSEATAPAVGETGGNGVDTGGDIDITPDDSDAF